jgi:glutamyl-tRNA(Gln) amidotransferase subunit E
VRVVAGLDQQPILLSSERWPDYVGSPRELRRLRRHLGCGPSDGVVVVWGPERDTITAAEEVRLRYVEATDGVPNETRQPFPDGSTDFERILPGPDRMYPDTDSPPIRMTRERVAGLQAALPPPPWVREERYAAAGVPRETIHYLIRRNGAALVDRVVEQAGADLRRACFLLGEQLKGLRRAGVAVDALTPERWCELFEALGRRPALWGARLRLVEALAAAPYKGVEQVLAEQGLNVDPVGWEEQVEQSVVALLPDHAPAVPEGLVRFHMGPLMYRLRGLVPAREVRAAVERALEGAPQRTPQPTAEQRRSQR